MIYYNWAGPAHGNSQALTIYMTAAAALSDWSLKLWMLKSLIPDAYSYFYFILAMSVTEV